MIVITTMDTLPDYCYDCPCYNGEHGICEADKEKRSTFEYRPYWCPLKEVKTMPDREKVIKGLECHQIDKDHRINCSECPYHCDEFMNGLNELHNDALELLKEQEAVEPTLIREGRNKNYNDYVCPRCDNEVVYEQNYCSECGVRFLWEGR